MLRRLSVLALLVAAQAVQAQVQKVDFESGTPVTSTTPVGLAALGIPGSGVSDVALSAHVYLEGAGFAYDDYQIAICKGSASGPQVGVAAWTPGDETPTSQAYDADTLFVTGFDPDVTLPAVYVLCVSKVSAASPDVTAYLRGFDAESAPAGTTLSGSESHGIVLVQQVDSTAWTPLATITVGAASASDVLLTAHVVVRGEGLGGGHIYEFGICKETAGGTRVGETRWRPPLTADAYVYSGDTIALTGFDANVSGTLHYLVCAHKLDMAAPTLSVAQVGLHGVRAPTDTTVFGTEALGSPVSATLETTSYASAASIDVDGSRPYSVRLTAHAYLEGQGYDANSRYEVGICRGSASGAEVGRAFWRPVHMDTDGYLVGDTLTLTGFDASRDGPTTYVVCARKFDSGAPTVQLQDTGIVATVPEPEEDAAAFAAFGMLAALRARRPRRPKSLRSTRLRE